MRRNWSSEKGFTLLELLVVMAIVSILVALLLPAISQAKSKSQQTKCESNIHQIDLAIRMYADDNKDTLPLLSPQSPEGVWQAFRPMVQSYLGIQSPAASKDQIFICPADTFSIEFDSGGPFRGGPAHETATMPNFTSYLFNGFNTKTDPPTLGMQNAVRTVLPAPGIAGRKLATLLNAPTTVLVAEAPAFVGFSWHKPHKELLFCDALNEVGYVDGHVSFVKIFWNGSLAESGSACYYDPPKGYAYTWSGK
jgi:prepilin-type N-terminal cleavage/methylation domain-containing protein